MGKKIVILNGSPRKNGNTQMILNLYAEMLQKQDELWQMMRKLLSILERTG